MVEFEECLNKMFELHALRGKSRVNYTLLLLAATSASNQAHLSLSRVIGQIFVLEKVTENMFRVY